MRRETFTIGVPRLWAVGGLAFLAMVAVSHIVMLRAFMAGPVLQDTYYVVTHWRPVIGCAAVFGVFAGWYYLFPRVTGWSYSILLGKGHFWLTFIGIGASIGATDFLLLLMTTYERTGMLPDALRCVNLVSLTGAYIAAAGTLVFFVNMALALWRRQPAR